MITNLDMFRGSERIPGVIIHQGDVVIRPDEKELATFVGLDREEYRDEYRRRCGRYPNAKAWNYWHRFHDKIVLRRGLR